MRETTGLDSNRGMNKGSYYLIKYYNESQVWGLRRLHDDDEVRILILWIFESLSFFSLFCPSPLASFIMRSPFTIHSLFFPSHSSLLTLQPSPTQCLEFIFWQYFLVLFVEMFPLLIFLHCLYPHPTPLFPRDYLAQLAHLALSGHKAHGWVWSMRIERMMLTLKW